MSAQCVDDGTGICPQCNRPFATWSPKPWNRACSAGKADNYRLTDDSSISKIVWNYNKAIIKWVVAGSPIRPQEEIDRIFSICERCVHYTPGSLRNQCRLCGCSLNRAPNGLINKIAMATEHCPDNPPKWGEDLVELEQPNLPVEASSEEPPKLSPGEVKQLRKAVIGSSGCGCHSSGKPTTPDFTEPFWGVLKSMGDVELVLISRQIGVSVTRLKAFLEQIKPTMLSGSGITT